MQTQLLRSQEVSNAEFGNAMKMLAQSMTNQNNWVHAPLNSNGKSATERVLYIDTMNPPEISGSQTKEDPQNFVDEIKKIFEVMQVTGNERV